MKLDAAQQDAIDYALSHRFAIINGGAGTGKSTIIKQIASELGDRAALCAFAGKAAARMREATGFDASTIHRLLGYKGEGLGFSVPSLTGRVVILDEASMVGSDLLSELVRRNPDGLILVGDEAQLPPVTAGQPFHDLVHLRPECVRTLTTCYRNHEAIFDAAMQVRAGSVPPNKLTTAGESWAFTAKSTDEQTHDYILNLVRNGGIDFEQDILLTCRNGDVTTPCTVDRLNADIKAMLNPSSQRIAVGDRVMCVKNSPLIDCWNGTTGTAFDFSTGGEMWVRLDYPAHGKNGADVWEVCIPRKDQINWVLAYALTVHKSQGSQYRRVFFACCRRDIGGGLLDRPMVYTAMTRAKRCCDFVGDAPAFRRAVLSSAPKHTVLQELLKVEDSNGKQ